MHPPRPSVGTSPLPLVEHGDDGSPWDDVSPPPVLWYVLVPTGDAAPELHCFSEREHLRMDQSTHDLVEFGADEAAARRHFEALTNTFSSPAPTAPRPADAPVVNKHQARRDGMEQAAIALTAAVGTTPTAGSTSALAHVAEDGDPLGPTPFVFGAPDAEAAATVAGDSLARPAVHAPTAPAAVAAQAAPAGKAGGAGAPRAATTASALQPSPGTMPDDAEAMDAAPANDGSGTSGGGDVKIRASCVCILMYPDVS